jgi:hypothetical protein
MLDAGNMFYLEPIQDPMNSGLITDRAMHGPGEQIFLENNGHVHSVFQSVVMDM